MKRLFVLLSAVLVALGAQDAAAQARAVTGQVTSAETGQPLPGVTVLVKGTTIGTQTNAEGRYTINVPASASTLVFNSVAHGSREAPITGATVNVALSQQAVTLEGVVVTALGIEQQERSLGTSVQALRGEEVAEARETNVINALSGRISGVTITNAGPQGGSSRIVIRGASSISGNNQPLFVVDGIPIDNSANRLHGYGGVDYGNAAQDINPSDIESISVLKGPNAAALYGSRAANGAIIITTKKGRNSRGLGITATTNVSYENPLRLPDYQDQYGQGLNGRFAYVDGAGGGTYDGVDESWGPVLDGKVRPQFFGEGPWVAQPNNVRDFFNTGRTANTNVALTGSSENANVRFSVTRLDQEGMYPGQELVRTTVGLNGGARLGDRLSADAAVQYIDADAEGRPGVGYGGDNPMQQFIWFGRQVDINQLRNPRDAQGNHYNWNYNYHSNPFWIAQENRNFDGRDRIIGSGTLSFEATDWLTATLRSGTDWYRDWRKRTYAVGDIGLGYTEGAFYEDLIYNRETNSEFLLRAVRDFGPFGFNANFGANRRDNQYQINSEGADRLVVPGVYNIGNSAVTPDVASWTQNKRVNSLLGSAQVSYNDYLFVDVTGRNDWSSTLPDGNNSYFYPSVSTSLVFTDAVPALASNLLSYGKLRASWARVGNDTDPYQLRSAYLAQSRFGSTPRFAVSNRLANANLRPEETTSVEVGTELSFLDNRLTLDATLYNSRTRNQILAVPVSPTTGFTEAMLNAGEITNRGVELLTTFTPIRTGDFEWNSTVNFAKNNNRVTELYGDLATVVLGTYWSLTVEARKNERYGALYGTPYRRDSQGRIIVGGNGLPLKDPQKKVLGYATPDWTGGWNNQFRYKNLDFSFLFDTKQGGNIFSVTHMFGLYAGVLEETVKGRCLPNPPADSGYPTCNAQTGIVVPGVKVVNGDTVANDIAVAGQSYFASLYGNHEAHILDASFIKLREMKLGFTLPESLNRRMGVSSANISLIGRNLKLWAEAPHIDPETAFDASNAQGLEFGQLPSARSIGLSVTITP